MIICDHQFHAVFLQQSSDRERKILEKLKNTVKRMLRLYTTFWCVCVCVCVQIIFVY